MNAVQGCVLIVSNGYGEDAIACGIVASLQRTAPTLRLLAMPLVGEGRAYQKLGVEVVGPRELLPSGGLILAGWSNILSDMRAGLWRVTRGQIKTLRQLGPQLGALVACGDTYPVLLGGFFTPQRVIMVGTAKSNYFVKYSAAERAIFRRCCEIVFARDEPTAATLRAYGIAARWVGNGMMDLLGQSGQPLPVADDTTCVAILPGSRKSAYRDLPVILDAVRRLGQARPASWLMALADSVDVSGLAQAAEPDGWQLEAADGPGLAGRLVGHGQDVWLVSGRFGDVLHRCDLVIGQAGTGNEQAAGLGKPVISFDSDGRARPGWYRARQMGLLGNSLAVVPRNGDAIAREALAILDDPARYERMRQAGFERMGPPGASDEIAAYIAERVQKKVPGTFFEREPVPTA
jgi:uncharacterized protein (TIGR03492 family)